MVIPSSSLRSDAVGGVQILLASSRADDARRIRRRLPCLGGVPVVCTVQGCLDTAIRFVEERRPDIVLLDLDLEDGAGHEGLPALVAAAGSSPVIVLGEDGDERVTRALRAGAIDFVSRRSLGKLSVHRTLSEVRQRHLFAVERRLLNRLPILLAKNEDLQTIITLALAEICKATGWRLGEAWIPAPEDDARLRRVASWASELPDRHDFEAVSRQMSFARGEGLPGRVWSSMCPMWIADVSRCTWYQRGIPAYRAGLRTALGIPVACNGRLAAVFVVYADHVRERHEEIVELLCGAAGPLGVLLGGHQQHRAAENVRRELEGMADTLAEGVFIVDGDGAITFANRELGGILGRDARELIGRRLDDFDHTLCTPDGMPYPDPTEAPVARVFRERKPIREAVIGLRRADSPEPVIVSVNAAPHFDACGKLTGVIASFRDITEQERAAHELSRSEERFATAFRANPLAMAIVTLDEFRYLEANAGMEALFGLPRERILGQRLADLPVEIEPGVEDDLKHALTQKGRVSSQEFWVRSRNGKLHELLVFGEPVEVDGKACFLGVAHDITERKRIERELEDLALHDSLTGLPNRNLFEDRLGHAFESSEHGLESMAVLFIDLDRFKIINDSMGHAAGDELIAAAADRFRSCFRRRDTIARVGGDEFAAVLEHLESFEEVSEMAEGVIEAFQRGFDLRGKTIHLTPSIGIAHGSTDVDRPADLLRYADVAMYRAKQEGGAGFRVFDPTIDLSATRRLDREARLRQAIDAEELIVRYQPVVSCHDGRIVGAEALVAWEHPDEGLIPPGEFIPLAEETGLIIPLGRFVLRDAAERAERWRSLGSPECPFRISVNVSPRQMSCPKLLTNLQEILEETGTPPSTLVLELTEGVLVRNPEMTAALRDLGVAIAVDDLGTGYASLEYLTRIDVDLLKLDRMFTGGLGSDRAKTAIVEAVLLMADRLDIPLVAEGIETEEQLRLLRDLRCRYGQGFHFARPMRAEEFERLLEEAPTW